MAGRKNQYSPAQGLLLTPELQGVTSDWVMPHEFPDLSAASRIAIDLETKDLELMSKGPGVRRGAHIVGMAIGTDDGGRWYFPMRHESGPNIDPDLVITWAKRELTRENQPKVGANLLYDLDFLTHTGVDVKGPFFDVQIAEPLLNENRFSFSLGVLSKEYLGIDKEETLLEQAGKAHFLKDAKGELYRLPAKFVGPYAEGDVDRPLRIFDIQKKRLEAEGLWDLFMLETRLVPCLLAMRQRGVRVDLPRTERFRQTLVNRQAEAQAQLDNAAGFQVNCWSAIHLARLCDAAGIKYPRTAKTNAPSFNKVFLEDLSKKGVAFAKLAHSVRKYDKFRSTFIDGSILNMHVKGRLHTEFKQFKSEEGGTVTGRFASAHPNLQFIPGRDEELAHETRALFVPEPGEDWESDDVSQFEYRLLAHYAVGPHGHVPRDAYNRDPNTDFHKMVSELSGLDRKPAKIMNFGMAYGMGKRKMMAAFGVREEEAELILEQYHERCPFVKETLEACSRVAQQRGYVKTILGRRRRFHMGEPVFGGKPLPWDEAVQEYGRHKVRRSHTHKALNAVLQGSNADLIKKAMVDIWESGVCSTTGAALLTVHDELDWSIPRTAEGREASREIHWAMEKVYPLRVPIVVSQGFGANWAEAH